MCYVCLKLNWSTYSHWLCENRSADALIFGVSPPGSLGDSGEQVEFYQEYVLLFGVFDESYSWNKPSDTDTGSHVKHTINGYTNGSVPGQSINSSLTSLSSVKVFFFWNASSVLSAFLVHTFWSVIVNSQTYNVSFWYWIQTVMYLTVAVNISP